MLRSLISATLLLSGAAAFASESPPANQQAPSDMPNLIVVRTTLNADGTQATDDAKVIALSGVTLARDAAGNIDWQQVVKDTDSQVSQAQQIPLKPTSSDNASVPDAVKQVFQQADQQSETEQLNWRWYYPYSYGGLYGYGYYPYWGYYNNYYPYYGYYYNSYVYPYYYGYYYPYSGYAYSYYYYY
jgi:hypothetical protein